MAERIANATVSGERALEKLAEILHAIMEELDPTEDADWDNLTDHQREFYRQ